MGDYLTVEELAQAYVAGRAAGDALRGRPPIVWSQLVGPVKGGRLRDRRDACFVFLYRMRPMVPFLQLGRIFGTTAHPPTRAIDALTARRNTGRASAR